MSTGRNQRLSIARAWMHERVCMSRCGGDNDHARRTHHNFARDAASAATITDLTRAIHEHSCLHGDRCNTEAHLSHLGRAAADLWARLEAIA